MAIRYQFLVSCKRVSEAAWMMEIQAENGEIPLSIVQPDAKKAGFLTVAPMMQEISDSNIMARYLRQLNRRNGRRSVGHNHSVVWNVSQRLTHLQVGQKITVGVSYFEPKGLNSGAYEIKSLGVFPPSKPAEKDTRPPPFQLPQAVSDAIDSLLHQVEALQQECQSIRQALCNQEIRIAAMEEYIASLETENQRLKKAQDPEASQPARPQEFLSKPVADEADEEEKRASKQAKTMFKRVLRASSAKE